MNVAIIGKNSYIGNSIENYLFANYNNYKVEQLDVKNISYQSYDYSKYDVIIHVAAIVHKKNMNDSEIYKKVNTDLPIKIAELAKGQGVKQFIFLSSMSVYGRHKKVKNYEITENEKLLPFSLYGKSKMEAEKKLQKMHDKNFIVSIVRPPSVYGKKCKGNLFKVYFKLAKALYVIPNSFQNIKQGLLHIDNLCYCIERIIANKESGLFMPQDKELLSTGEIIFTIRTIIGKKAICSNFLGKILSLFIFIPFLKKIYGSIAYSEKLSKNNLYSENFITTKEGLLKTFN